MEGWQHLSWYLNLLRNALAHNELIPGTVLKGTTPPLRSLYEPMLGIRFSEDLALVNLFSLAMHPDAAYTYLGDLVRKQLWELGEKEVDWDHALPKLPKTALTSSQPVHRRLMPLRHKQPAQLPHGTRRRPWAVRTHSCLQICPCSQTAILASQAVACSTMLASP